MFCEFILVWSSVRFYTHHCENLGITLFTFILKIYLNNDFICRFKYKFPIDMRLLAIFTIRRQHTSAHGITYDCLLFSSTLTCTNPPDSTRELTCCMSSRISSPFRSTWSGIMVEDSCLPIQLLAFVFLSSLLIFAKQVGTSFALLPSIAAQPLPKLNRFLINVAYVAFGACVYFFC